MSEVTDPFPALEQAIRANLPRHLPGGVTLTSVCLGERELRVEARKGFLSITVTALVTRSPDSVRVHWFELKGAFGLGDAALRDEIASIDELWPPYRARGERGGDGLVFTRG